MNRPEWTGGSYAPDGSVVAVGNFDGLHRGHFQLISRCREAAAAGEAVAVVTFEPLPQAFFRPDQAPPRLTTVYQKLQLLRAFGVDLCWLMRFDRRLSNLSARDFVEQVLIGRLSARRVVVGEDFRFGRGREGDLDLLHEVGRPLGMEAETHAAVKLDGQRVSSSGIRQLLANGDFGTAAEWLGRPFQMEGHVVRGAGLGRSLGYPTANLRIRARPSPLSGVLAGFARVVGGAWLPAVTNLGWRPAVGGNEPLLEVHFFDFDEDLYGQRLEVRFVAKLRDEMNFESMEDLVAQMQRDEAVARRLLAEERLPD